MKKYKLLFALALLFSVGVFLWYRLANVSQSFKTFTKEDEYTVDLYFADRSKDPNREACSYVYPRERVIKASRANLVLKTIETMIAGPTDEEKSQGVYSALPKDSELVYFGLDGTRVDVYVDYNLKEVDTCGTQALESQIRQTILQFSNITEVEVNSPDLVTREEKN